MGGFLEFIADSRPGWRVMVMFLFAYEIFQAGVLLTVFLENAQKVGMVLLLAIMVFAIGNDILKLFTGT